jgi:hypothetical protein
MIDRLESEVERERLANENVTALLTRANAEVERLTRERDEMKRCADSAETRWEEVAKLALERERLVFASEARAEKAERERDEAISDYSREYDKHVASAAESARLRKVLRRAVVAMDTAMARVGMPIDHATRPAWRLDLLNALDVARAALAEGTKVG